MHTDNSMNFSAIMEVKNAYEIEFYLEKFEMSKAFHLCGESFQKSQKMAEWLVR